MKLAITKDFSKVNLFEDVIVGSLRTRSDDVVEAAWNAGIGIHALIWVWYAQL
jgi:hypothetical protein